MRPLEPPQTQSRRIERRSQGERRAESRRRLLDATVQILNEEGYASTTIAAVARRAGLSVGCLQNYFPTKARLLADAMTHLFERKALEFELAFRELPDAEDRVARGVELIWELYQGGSFRSFLELVAAAQADREIREQVMEAQDRIAEVAFRAFWQVFEPAPGVEADRIGVPATLLAAIQGLALSRLAHPGREDWKPALATIEGAMRRLLRPRTTLRAVAADSATED
jgi:AcrR family transcriptional regulator